MSRKPSDDTLQCQLLVDPIPIIIVGTTLSTTGLLGKIREENNVSHDLPSTLNLAATLSSE